MNLLFVLSGLYLNILGTRENIARFWGEKILDVRGKRLNPRLTVFFFNRDSVQ